MATLKVEKRDKTGKYAAFNMRKEGYIPGVVYGKSLENNLNVRIPLKEFQHLLHEGDRIIDLEMDGQSMHTLLKDVQHGTFDHEIMHADFRAVSETDTINVELQIELKGDAKGLEAGGMIDQNLFSVEIECLPRNLPNHVTVDVSKLNIGDVISVADLPKLEGVTYMTDAELPVVSCNLPDQADEETEEGEEAVATEPEVIGEKKEEDAGEAEE